MTGTPRDDPAANESASPSARDGRHHRQELFLPDGPDAQGRLRRATVTIVGCGALGTNSAELLVRAGIGSVRLVDRDVVEWSNLHRQVGYTERDAREHRAKSHALAEHLARVDSDVRIEPHAIDFNFSTAAGVVRGSDLIVDGTDNLATRFLINDLSYAHAIPWIYAGAVGGDARVQLFSGDAGPCLRCILPELPPPGALPTCDTAGILGPVAAVAASWQATLALRFLATGSTRDLAWKQAILSPWNVSARVVGVAPAADCSVCVKREFEFLRGDASARVTPLCGRRAVQVLPAADRYVEFPYDDVVERLKSLGTVVSTPPFSRFRTSEFVLTIFRDGRAIFDGLTDPNQALSLYARLVGQ